MICRRHLNTSSYSRLTTGLYLLGRPGFFAIRGSFDICGLNFSDFRFQRIAAILENFQLPADARKLDHECY